MAVVTARTTPAEQTLADRLLAAVPLLSIFLWLAIVYVIQAWAHKTPWLFGDELELTQLSRAQPDAVLVTIPDAPRERLGLVIDACTLAQVPCRFVRRNTDLDPRAVLGAAVD